MKSVFVASLLATLLAVSTAFATERTANPQQPKGTEGPDVQYSRTVVPGPEGLDVR